MKDFTKKLAATALCTTLLLGTFSNPPAARADDIRKCGYVHNVAIFAMTDLTSCEFALSVADAVWHEVQHYPRAQTLQVIAYSPVTGERYLMDCGRLPGTSNAHCTGGNNAEVGF